MKKILLAFLVFTVALSGRAQQLNFDQYKAVMEKFPASAEPNMYDSLYQQNIKELSLPENLKNFVLPAVVDNSELPYLRPVFSQVGASCGQASAIGYNFTYEMDQARNLAADTSINQYPTHFVYNFQNTGYEYFGVSYFHSFEVLKHCGTMNVKDYGGLTDGGGRWITGYDLYYNGMHNRIEDVYAIKTNTSKGIQILKNWIYNHMGESTTGGVASFYIGWRDIKTLPAGTPEEGKFIVTNFYAPASHAMTIVGYNDSIRYDYNNDGQYTNTIDLNNDGIIDVKDWEIGGLKFVNSYGATDYDSGFCYMMYRTLAEGYNIGGIWNNAVHVVKVKADYKPLLTMKVKLKHTERVCVRVRAGLSLDPASMVPDHLLDFPIFNFQGGNYPMQGPGPSDTLTTIEFGLDITPLLSYIPGNKNVAFFLAVDENDPYSQATGSIESFSVIDYSTSTPQSVNSLQTPVEITNNDVSLARVVHSVTINKVRIANPALPAFVAGQPYTVQLAANGGMAPYNWSLGYDYTKLESNNPMPAFEGEKLLAQLPSDSLVAVSLGFSFPFYGKNYDTLFVNINNGYLQFTKDNIPWPYFSEENLLMKSFPLIVPLLNKNTRANNENEGAWYHSDSALASFRWKLSKKQGETYFPCELQAHISADGTITFNRSPVMLAASEQYHSGISDGTKLNHDLSVYFSEYTVNQYNKLEFIPARYPDNLKISSTGLVECLPALNHHIYSIPCKVSDYLNVTDEKTLVLSSGIRATLKFEAGNDSIIGNGEEVRVKLVLTNLTNNTYTNIKSELRINDTFITPVDTFETTNSLGPGGEITVSEAFRFTVSTAVPDGRAFLMDLDVSSNLQHWKQSIPAKIVSSHLKSIELKSNKPGNELLKPGELGTLQYRFTNIGHASAKQTDLVVHIQHPDVKLISSGTHSWSEIAPGQKITLDLQVRISDSISLGTKIPAVIQLSSENKIILTDTMYFRIGKSPVLVIDMDIAHESAPVIWQNIKDLGYNSDYAISITTDINEYQSLFICPGKFSTRHILSYSESRVLADYLDQGGNLYIESPNFWRDDLKTSLQPRFNTETKNKFHKYDTLTGGQGTFMDGFNFLNAGYQISMYHLLPLGNAFTLFHDEGFGCTIANDAGLFKTIGSLFAFSGISNANDSSSQTILMQKYLDFFNIKRNSVGKNDPQLVTPYDNIEVYPNPASEKVYFTFFTEEKPAIKVNIFNINGSLINELTAKSTGNSGLHSAEWNLCNQAGQRVPPGLYLCRILTSNEFITGKVLVK